MMMRFSWAIPAVGLLAFAGAATAQSPFSAELRLGAGIPQDFGELALSPGFGFEGTIRYDLPLCLQLYTGWDWYRFTDDQDADLDLEDTGYALGLRWTPMRLEQFLGPWLRGGIVYDHLEIEDADGELVSDSDHTLGFEVGGGVTIGRGRVALTPGVRYRRFSPEMQVGNVTSDAEDFSYLAVELGVVFDF